MSDKYNPHPFSGYACEHFLSLHRDKLDGLYSFSLQLEALALPDLASRLDFLLGQEVQGEINSIVEKLAATSIPVEKKNNQDRRSSKKHKVCISVMIRLIWIPKLRYHATHAYPAPTKTVPFHLSKVHLSPHKRRA